MEWSIEIAIACIVLVIGVPKLFEQSKWNFRAFVRIIQIIFVSVGQMNFFKQTSSVTTDEIYCIVYLTFDADTLSLHASIRIIS